MDNWERLIQEVDPLVKKGKLKQAVKFAEDELKQLPKTGFHSLAGKNLLQHVDDLADWINEFVEEASEEISLKAVYCKLNGFTLNTDRWYLDIFGYEKVGSLDNFEWLTEPDYEFDDTFTISGYEEAQVAFEKWYGSGEDHEDMTEEIKQSGEIAEFLIVLHIQELIEQTAKALKKRKSVAAKLPIFCTAHDWDIVFVAK